jgi:hypothetical protein
MPRRCNLQHAGNGVPLWRVSKDIRDCGYAFAPCKIYRFADARRMTIIDGFRDRDSRLIRRAGIVIDFSDGQRWSRSGALSIKPFEGGRWRLQRTRWASLYGISIMSKGVNQKKSNSLSRFSDSCEYTASKCCVDSLNPPALSGVSPPRAASLHQYGLFCRSHVAIVVVLSTGIAEQRPVSGAIFRAGVREWVPTLCLRELATLCQRLKQVLTGCSPFHRRLPFSRRRACESRSFAPCGPPSFSLHCGTRADAQTPARRGRCAPWATGPQKPMPHQA